MTAGVFSAAPGRAQVPTSVRAILVVVRGILVRDRPEVPCPGVQHRIGDLSPGCPHPEFGMAVRSGT